MGRRVMLLLFAFALVWSATEQQKILDEYSGKASPNSWIIQQPNRKPLPASYLPPGGMLLMTMDPAMMMNEQEAAAVPAPSSEKPLDEPSASSQSPEELIPPVEEEDQTDPVDPAIPADPEVIPAVPEVSPTVAEESAPEDPSNQEAPELNPPVEEESNPEDPPVVQEPVAVSQPVEEESNPEDPPVVQEPAAENPPAEENSTPEDTSSIQEPEEEESTPENPPAVQESTAVNPPEEEESTSEDTSSIQEPVDPVKPTESTPENPVVAQEPAAVSLPVPEEPNPEDPSNIQEQVDVKPTTDADEGSPNDISSVTEEEQQQPAPADSVPEVESVENQVQTEDDNELASLIQEDPEPLPTTVASEDVIFVTTQVYNTDPTLQGVVEQSSEQSVVQQESIGDLLGQVPTAVNEGSGDEGSGVSLDGSGSTLVTEEGFIPFETETTTTSELESSTDAPQGSNSIDLEINDPEEDQLAQLRRNLLSVKEEEEEVSANEAVEAVEGDEEARQYQRRPYPIRPGAARPPQRNGGPPHQNYHPDDAYFMSRTYEYCYTLWCKFKTGLKSVGLL